MFKSKQNIKHSNKLAKDSNFMQLVEVPSFCFFRVVALLAHQTVVWMGYYYTVAAAAAASASASASAEDF